MNRKLGLEVVSCILIEGVDLLHRSERMEGKGTEHQALVRCARFYGFEVDDMKH